MLLRNGKWMPNSQKAIALLVRRPDPVQVEFYRGLVHHGYDVFVVIDDPDWREPLAGVTAVQVHVDACAADGFRNLNPMITERVMSPCSAWEKALYFFCVERNDYEHVWFVEDDVFAPTLDAFVLMDEKYSDDIVGADYATNLDGETASWEWYVHVPEDRLPLPWVKAMVCAVRLGRAVLDQVRDFLSFNRDFDTDLHRATRKFFFIEYIFHTLAAHAGLKIVAAAELDGIVFRRDWIAAEINPTHLYHPMKQIHLQEDLRRQVMQSVRADGLQA